MLTGDPQWSYQNCPGEGWGGVKRFVHTLWISPLLSSFLLLRVKHIQPYISLSEWNIVGHRVVK